MNIKKSKYDDDVFFNKCKETNRSVRGLEGVGEWSQLKQLLPGFKGKHVLGLGCGYGQHYIYVTQQKAASVHDVDISRKILAVAEGESRDYAVAYQRSVMEDLQLFRKSFDVAISSLAFRYVKDFKRLAAATSTWLTPKGSFVFSVEYPVFTAHGIQD